MSVGPRAEKFNIVSNDHGRTYKCDFSVFERKYPFWANLVKKNQNCQRKVKFSTETNSKMQNSMALFTFSVLYRNTLFGQIWSKRSIVSLGCNLVRRVTRICRIQWHCSLFLFYTGNTLFGHIWSRKSELSV